MLRLRGSDPFEEALAWELAPHGPVVAVGRPGRSLATLGAARDHLPDDQWREGVSDRMADAAAIVVVIAATDGLAWEVGEIARDGHLGKTVFVFPPTTDEELRRRWQFVDGVLDGLGVRNAPFPIDTADPLTANLLPSGFWHLTVASYRDEASYCAAIDVAMAVATSNAGQAPPVRGRGVDDRRTERDLIAAERSALLGFLAAVPEVVAVAQAGGVVLAAPRRDGAAQTGVDRIDARCVGLEVADVAGVHAHPAAGVVAVLVGAEEHERPAGVPQSGRPVGTRGHGRSGGWRSPGRR